MSDKADLSNIRQSELQVCEDLLSKVDSLLPNSEIPTTVIGLTTVKQIVAWKCVG